MQSHHTRPHLAHFTRSIACVAAMMGTSLAAAPAPSAAETFATDQVKVSLVGESRALAPGQTAWLGLRLQHAPHWHTYWINPGDSGLPTRLAWSLPPGFKAGEIAWPTPKRFKVDQLANFGYDGDILLPVPITVPVDVSIGSRVHLQVEAKWLVCHEECIPGKATLALDLPVAARADPDPSQRAAFATARLAQPENGLWKAAAKIADDHVEVTVRGVNLADGAGVDAFAQQTKIASNAPPQYALHDGIQMLIFAKSDYFTSIPQALDLVVTRRGARAIRVHAPFAAASTSTVQASP